MSWLSRLNVGMRVEGTDGLVGHIASIPRVDLDDPSAPAEVVVLAASDNATPGSEEFRVFTRGMVDHIAGDFVQLNVPHQRVPHASQGVAAAHRGLPGWNGPLRIPVVEEEVSVNRRVIDIGHLHVHKGVENLVDERIVALRQQGARVDRVPVDNVVDQYVAPYMDGDTFVVPVIEEEVIVSTRLRLREELRIQVVSEEHQKTIRTPFRRETVTITEHRVDGVNEQQTSNG